MRAGKEAYRQLFDKALGSTAIVALAAAPSVALLISAGITKLPGFWAKLIDGQPDQIVAATFTLAAGAMASFALKYRSVSEQQDSAVRELGLTVSKLRQQQEVDHQEMRAVLTDEAAKDAVLTRIIADEDKLKNRISILEARTYEEIDHPKIWQVVPRSTMISFEPRANREAEENIGPQGVTFRASAWGKETWLPRITVGTNLSDWKVVFVVPAREPAFDNLVWWPARKFLAVLDDLHQNIGPRCGLDTTLSHIRISIVREILPQHQFCSIHSYIRQTENGQIKTVIKYHRPQTSRATDYNDGKISIIGSDAEQYKWTHIAEQYFHAGVQLTVEQLREALAIGRFPAPSYSVAVGDHFRP